LDSACRCSFDPASEVVRPYSVPGLDSGSIYHVFNIIPCTVTKRPAGYSWSFSLNNLAEAPFRAFGPAKVNPHGETVRETVGVWLTSFKNHSLSKAQARLDQYSSIATYYFPDVDVKHLETCVAAMYWSFTVDDVAEEGDLHTRLDHVKSDINI